MADLLFWKRNKRSPFPPLGEPETGGKGVLFSVVALLENAFGLVLPQALLLYLDSKGRIDRITVGCPPIQIGVVCRVECEKCKIIITTGGLYLHPGLRYRGRFTSTTKCCPGKCLK